MENFVYSIATKIFFGQGQIKVLAREIKNYGNKVLLTYGSGSIKKNGIYDSVIKELRENDIEYFELAGIEPNPRLESVIEGVKIARENEVDFILAVGGGSTIDCSKAIAVSYYYDGNPWDLVKDSKKIQKALPLGTVLTMAATGSEMNSGAVISNMEVNEKLGFGHREMAPKFSILDPSYSFSLPKNQTAAGISDIMSHTFENYFSQDSGAILQDRFAEGILKTCIECGPVALENPEDYTARSNLMWASSMAINGIISLGKDLVWSVHAMEHELSAFYDITHGVGLAILTPRWMNYVLDEDNLGKFVEYGVNVWNIDGNKDHMDIAREAIEKTHDFFKSLGLPMNLSDLGIGREKFSLMAERAVSHKGGKVGNFKELDKDDIYNIYVDSL